QRPGSAGRTRLDDVQQRQAPGPDRQGYPIGRSQLAGEMPELVKGFAVSSGQSKELGKLADGDVDRQPEDETGHDRMRNERNHEPEPHQPHSRKMIPTTKTSRTSSSANSRGSVMRNGATTVAIMIDDPEVGAETAWRVVPRMA